MIDRKTITTPSSLTLDQLLEIAIREYPIGTKYDSINSIGEPSGYGEQVSNKTPVLYGNDIECGTGYIYSASANKWATKITGKELFEGIELIREIKRRYPDGSEYIPLQLPKNENRDKKYYIDHQSLVGGKTLAWSAGDPGFIYQDGEWADIINSKETNLEKAIRLYPPGTQYKALDSDGTSYYGQDVISIVDSKHHQFSDGDIDAGSGFLYSKKADKWAQIISTPSMNPCVEVPLDENKEFNNLNNQHVTNNSTLVQRETSTDGQGEGCSSDPIRCGHRKTVIAGYNPQYQEISVSGKKRVRISEGS